MSLIAQIVTVILLTTATLISIIGWALYLKTRDELDSLTFRSSYYSKKCSHCKRKISYNAEDIIEEDRYSLNYHKTYIVCPYCKGYILLSKGTK